jgi:quercetin dioxygenase-like cupin family protein
MKVLGAGPAERADRAATALLHDEPHARVVAFHLGARQQVPPHRSDSTVLVHVTSGRGVFRGAGDVAAELEAGQSAAYAPGEMHSIEAGDKPLQFVAVITPRPGG